MAGKWPVQSAHSCLEPSLKISGAIPPLNMSPTIAHSGTTSFYRNHLRTYLSTGHNLSGLIKEPFYTSLTPYMHNTWHLRVFHHHWSNYINIMNSSNNKLHYIFFWVLLLLTPSVSQKFSWQHFSLSPSKHVIPSMWEVTFYTHKNERNVWFLMDEETFHCKQYFTCTESQNKGFFY